MKIELRKQKEENVCIFYDAFQNGEVNQWMYRHPSSLEKELVQFRKQKDDQVIRRTIYAENVYIGDIWATFVDSMENVDVLLSCCIFDRTYWNRGIASEALSLFANELKQTYHISNLGAFLYAENKGSQKVLEKQEFALVNSFEENGKTAYFYFKKW